MTDTSSDEPLSLRRRAQFAVASLVLLVLSALVACALAEVVVRLVAPQQLIQIRPDLWQPEDTLGWRLRSGVSGRINTGERTVSIFSDRDGFRVGQAGRREADTRVLLIGDSFVEAIQVEYEQTFGALLERESERRLGRPVVVRNAGVGGWSPDQYLIRARQILARESFDLVLVTLFTGNDAIRQARDYYPPRPATARQRFGWPESFSTDAIVRAWLSPVNDKLEVRSHFFVLLKNQLAGLRMKLGMSADYFPSELLRSQADSPRWTVTAAVAAEIARLADSNGAHTLFVLVPDRIQVYEEDLRRYAAGFGIDSSAYDIDQPTRLLRESFIAEGLDVIDALPLIRAAAADHPRLYGTVDPHLSPQGHVVLSEILAPAVATALMASEAPPGR